MGLGSAPIMGLSAARAIAMLHGLPANDATALAIAAGVDPGEGLPIQAFAQGGLLLVDEAGAALRRHVLPNDNEARDWAFVLVLPHPPAGAPEHLEASARRDLWQAAAHLDDRAEALLRGRLWPAAEGDDIAAFASALTELRALSLAPPPSPAEQAIFTIMAAEGALAWGCAATGLGIYGLVRGGEASRQLRRALSEHLGHTGGTVMATICEPSGARVAGA
jgi:predicted sugar kinase